MSGKIARAMLACLVGAMLVACNNDKQSERGGSAPHQLTRKELSAAEQKYGLAPVPDKSVTYQPDVILVGGGPEAIRDLDANGFVWTIDSTAPRASELEPGKIFFMTGRAVGRVLDVRKAGSSLIVTIGPADITDIIREAHIHIHEMAVNFGDAIAYSAPDFPGRVVPLTRTLEHQELHPALLTTEAGWHLQKTQLPITPPLPPESPHPVIDIKNFVAIPKVTLSQIGIEVNADKQPDFKFLADAALHLLSPKLTLDIDITPLGGVTNCTLLLTGAAGLNWHFKTGYAQKTGANIKVLVQPDVDFSIPIVPIGGIPLAITLRQRFEVQTGVLVENSTLSAEGGYTFTGGFMVGYVKPGKWTAEAPHDYTTDQSMTKTGEGISLGEQGLTLAHSLKVIVGLGAHGFAVGPYLVFQSAIGAFRNSSAGMLECKGATLVVSLIGGVGYVIPKAIVKLVNSLLSFLNVKYRITGEGGIQPSEPKILINKSSQMGGCPRIDDGSGNVGTVRGGP